jgi:hypothetical protein
MQQQCEDEVMDIPRKEFRGCEGGKKIRASASVIG